MKLLTRKLKDACLDVEDTLLEANKKQMAALPPGRLQPSIRKKDREYLGMFSYKIGEEGVIVTRLVVGKNFLWC